jgi:hypothetical protein
MATVTVQGKVSRTFFNGKGAEVVEELDVKGKPVQKRWDAWFEQPHGLNDGDTITVSGLHGDAIDEWEKDGETRRKVKRTLNKARLVNVPDAAAPDNVSFASASVTYDESTPF